jgi:hypothetical protein
MQKVGDAPQGIDPVGALVQPDVCLPISSLLRLRKSRELLAKSIIDQRIKLVGMRDGKDQRMLDVRSALTLDEIRRQGRMQVFGAAQQIFLESDSNLKPNEQVVG